MIDRHTYHYRRHRTAPVACGKGPGGAIWTTDRTKATCLGCIAALGRVRKPVKAPGT